MSDSKPTKQEALKWLVQSRNNIQRLLLRLHQYHNEPNGRVWQRHVGAAFSLWRAVFLCHDAEELERKLDLDATKFLKTVIERNAIGFSDDHTSRAWTGGYYINNALYRLGMRTYDRPRHGSQRILWEEAYKKLDELVPKDSKELPDS